MIKVGGWERRSREPMWGEGVRGPVRIVTPSYEVLILGLRDPKVGSRR